jgi:hypothetical protein
LAIARKNGSFIHSNLAAIIKGEVREGGKDRKPKRANENKMMGIQKQKKKERKAGK